METDHISDEEVSIWLAFNSLAGFGPKRVLRLDDRFRGIQAAWHASKVDLMTVADMNIDAAEELIQKRKEVDPEALLKHARRGGVRCIVFSDPAYPHYLRQIDDPPLVLFVLGEIKPYDFNNVIAVVGTRSCSSYGQKHAKEFARQLSENGAVVASGLALGIDSLAHWGAIEGGGRTIAVMATGPDVVYPTSNARLYNAILDGNGFVMSEFMPGMQPEKWHFPARNRIISGLSQAVLVVEAGETSGALITAQLAFEQNREVFAIPGRLDMPASIGTNRLIRDHKAQLVTSVKEILDAKNWVRTTINQVPTIVELYGREREVYEMLSNEPVHFDMMCERTGMNPGEMSATLTMLELAGLILRHAGDWYTRQDNQPVPVGRA